MLSIKKKRRKEKKHFIAIYVNNDAYISTKPKPKYYYFYFIRFMKRKLNTPNYW